MDFWTRKTWHDKQAGYWIASTGGIAKSFTLDLLVDPKTRGNDKVVHAIVAAASSSGVTRAKDFLKTVGAPSDAKAYGNYQDLANDPDVDIIYVATPHSHHYQDSMLCLEAGKNVLCEKAFTVNAAQAKKLVEKAQEKKVFLMEAVWTRYFPVSIYVRDLITSGRLGHVQRVFADTSVNTEPEKTWPDGKHRMVNPDLAGGSLLDLGIYSLTWVFQTLYTTQPEGRKPPKVLGSIKKYPQTGVDEMATIVLTFPREEGDAHGIASTTLRASSDTDGKGTAGPAVRVQGDKGELQVWPPLYRPTKTRLILTDGTVEDREWPQPGVEGEGLGMFWEADEAALALTEGRKEGKFESLEESIVIMEVMDEVRKQNDLKYPDKIETTDYPAWFVMSSLSQIKFYDFADWQMQQSPRQNSVSTLDSRTEEGAGISFWDPSLSPTLSTPRTTPPSSHLKPQRSEFSNTLLFNPPIAVSFAKGSSVFKLKFARVDVRKDAAGNLRCLELSDPDKFETSLIHSFPNTRLPIPHLERPYVPTQSSTFRVSFLEEQTVQTVGTLFQAKPDYTFEKWEDCIRLQEAILSQSVLFVAGIAQAKSKGRGEECISQNLRVLRSRSGRQIILFFANSQRKEAKKYVSVPLDSIDQFDPGKKANKPVTLKLGNSTDLTTILKTPQQKSMAKGRVRRLYKTDRVREFEHEQDRVVRAQQIYATIDRQPFQWIVVLVAGIGFFLDGYTLFASNIALPMLSYVYWPTETSGRRVTYINIATLAGTLFGQVFFGILADKHGRKKMYGVELVLLIAATLGVVMCSTGVDGSMNVFAWITFWRVIVGIGVGADYPLSAVITAELAPTKHRPRMMASVFFMQPLGQIAGNIVSLIVVAASQSQGEDNLPRTVDVMWRWVIGLGVVPGVLAVAFRFAIPETPRFLLEIEDDPIKAEFDATPLFGGDGDGNSTELESAATWESIPSAASHNLDDVILPAPMMPDSSQWISTGTPPVTLNSKWQLSREDITQYFWHEGNWRTLFGTASTWLLLDFSFYGIGLSSPQFLSKTWGNLRLSSDTSHPPWQIDDTGTKSIYQQFMATSVHALVILNVGSFLGMVIMIIFASRVNRVTLQKVGFCVLAIIFVILGSIFIALPISGGPGIIAMYIIAQTAFNFGPNATTYILSAEAFPTRFRSSCHGISAGAGKLGSILVQVFSAYYKFGSSSTSHHSSKRYGTIIIVFAVVMLVGAVITHFMIPDVQEKREKGSGWTTVGRNKTLEELALGRMGARSQSIARARRVQR
ncbi:hypothetical protein DV738_g3287, partial [Chaetothyriales sp. CBS 135597]